MSRVWDGSNHSGAELLMLLALADYADDEGRAYPSIATLATKCRTKTRYAIVLLNNLSASGELLVLKGQGPMGRGGRTNLYRIVFDRMTRQSGAQVVNSSAPVNPGAVVHPDALVNRSAPVHQGSASSAPECRDVVHQGAPKPSRNHQEPEKVRATRSPAADRGSRLPLNWTLPTEWKAFAETARPDIDVEATADSFADYWHAQPGAKSRKADWQAAWRYWVRNQRAPANAGPANRSRPNPMHADEQFA